MGWSTRELAELAGTTLRTVRHYHEIGLLEEPGRTANGYKQYGVDHLVRLLGVRRLVDLGMSLQQICELDDVSSPYEELRRVEAEVSATIERLRRMHGELRQTLERTAPVDLPLDLAAASADLTPRDRRLLVVLGRTLGPESIRVLAEMLRTLPKSDADAEFDALPEDAGEAARQALATRMLPRSLEMRARLPDLPGDDAVGDEQAVRRAIWTAVEEVYSPAQVDVLRRLGRLRVAAAQPGTAG